jgi:hypothetical protein
MEEGAFSRNRNEWLNVTVGLFIKSSAAKINVYKKIMHSRLIIINCRGDKKHDGRI